ncbi:MAG: thioredoxin family protein [Kiritimatiellia bacterium]
MKTRMTIVALALLLAGRALVAAGELKSGDLMPMGDVKMMNVDGRILSIQEAAGEKGALVVFSCNHCPFVKAWESRLAAIGNNSMKKGVGVIFINANDPVEFPTDDLDHMKEQAAAAGYEFPYVVDETSDVARAFGAARTPEVFLFDAAGRLVYHGAVDDNAYKPAEVQNHYLQDALNALVAGTEIPVKETRSVGCSIKYRAPGGGGK